MIYYLNHDKTPTIPVPHDCIIKRVDMKQNFLTFIFEDDISLYDSIKYIQPNAKSLIIKIHLIDDFYTYKFKYYKWPWCKETYTCIDNQRLIDIAKKGKLAYIGHRVGYQSIIIKLYDDTSVILDIYADGIEFEWIT